MRRQETLRQTERSHRLHLGQSLQRRRAWTRHVLGMQTAGKIALAQPRIVVRGSDQSIEVGFDRVDDRECKATRG